MNEHFILESSQNLIHPSSKIPNPYPQVNKGL